ncbi:hypothetical protein ACP90_21875 [Labrenzia sp. CP4]|jgi:hypothetical protein|uniref:hypothetical protein n=1 Tax=Labrenzia sp. CP4 TaxID=1674922 RepID=UPI0007860D34|nr:hypothetical protein [Labrenzia sp. CP4]AMN54606.1 hypothetical protein ACP90_21875 [Labrenzia sp. CP4]
MAFNHSIIFSTAWTMARETRANCIRNQHIYGTPRSLRSCFAQALRDGWFEARCAAIASRRTERMCTYAASLSPEIRAFRLEAAIEKLALLTYSNAVANFRSARQADLQTEIEALTMAA